MYDRITLGNIIIRQVGIDHYFIALQVIRILIKIGGRGSMQLIYPAYPLNMYFYDCGAFYFDYFYPIIEK